MTPLDVFAGPYRLKVGDTATSIVLHPDGTASDSSTVGAWGCDGRSIVLADDQGLPFVTLRPSPDAVWRGSKADGTACELQREIPKPGSRGLGDTIDKITTATGIKAAVKIVTGRECGGCDGRRQWLNEAVPYR